ncbi:MAG TPA: ParB/RepB/Spo0J family partition protein [Gemmataceae bacterium]|nr:ParB/RepB/Spo0J family partition protein [Gemmataceae bacterium]
MTTPTTAQTNGHVVPQAIPVAPSPDELGDGEERDIPIAEIDPDPDQPRQYFNEDEIQALADSLAADGQQNAGIVYRDPETGRYTLVAGERRWRALQRLGKKTMRVRVLKEPPDKVKWSRLRLLDNELQKQLTRLEKGFAYDNHLTLVGGTASALAQTLGASVSTVTRAIKDAQRLCPALKERFRAGTLPPDIAEELLTLPGDAQLAIAKQYPNPLKTKAEVKASVRSYKTGNGPTTGGTAGFSAEESGVRIACTWSSGDADAQVLANVENALRVLLKDLAGQKHRGLEQWKTFLAKKKNHALKSAELKAAQDALTRHAGSGGNGGI